MHYDAWIQYVFDHPVHDPAWHWADDAPYHDVGIPEVAELLTKTFRQSAHDLLIYSDDQVAQGLEFLVDNSCSSYMVDVRYSSLPLRVKSSLLDAMLNSFGVALPVGVNLPYNPEAET